MDSTSNLGAFFDFVHPFPSLLKLTLAISSYNSKEIFTKFGFLELAGNSGGLD